MFIHAHVGCSCESHSTSPSSLENQDSSPCMDACCAPPVLDEISIQVPFGFVKKKSRSVKSTVKSSEDVSSGPAPIIVSDEAPSLKQSFEVSNNEMINTDHKNIKSRMKDKLENMDKNVMAVMIHSAGDACSSLVVFAVGLIVYCMNDRDKDDWADYLDPLVTIVLSLVMAYAVKDIIYKSCYLLLESSNLTNEDQLKLKYDIKQALYKYDLIVLELIITDLDFDNENRRATVVLGISSQSNSNQIDNATRVRNISSVTSSISSSFDHSFIRKRVKEILKAKGVKHALVEIRCPGDSGLLGMEESHVDVEY